MSAHGSKHLVDGVCLCMCTECDGPTDIPGFTCICPECEHVAEIDLPPGVQALIKDSRAHPERRTPYRRRNRR